MKRSGIARRALAGVASLALAGCVSFGAKPPKHLIRLASDQPALATGADIRPSPGPAIAIADFEADPALETLRLPVQVDATSLAYLKDAMWIERPARQLRRLIAQALRQRGGPMVYEPGEDNGEGPRVALGGRIEAMGYDAPSHSVIVRMMATRQDPGGALRMRRFERSVAGVAPVAGAVVPALNQAANALASDVATWMLAR